MPIETFHKLVEKDTISEGLKVKKTDDLTLIEILTLYNTGIPMLRSPHVGNFSDGNLTVLGLGIPAIILDNNQLDKDTIYHPASLSKFGEVSQLCQPTIGKLSHFAQVESGQDIGKSVVNIHVDALKKAFRTHKNLLTLSESFLNAPENLIEDIVSVVASSFPELFKRKLINGITVDLDFRNIQNEISRLGIYPINRSDSGIIIPNELAIIVDLILQLQGSHEEILIELTGKTMFDYVNTAYSLKLAHIYSLILQKIKSHHLPKNPTLVLIPTSSARATVAMAQERSMRTVFENYIQLRDYIFHISRLKGEFINLMQSPQEVSALFDRPSKNLGTKLTERLRESVRNLPQIFSPIWHERVSQHDLSSGFYIDSRALSMTQNELSQMMKLCDKLYQNI